MDPFLPGEIPLMVLRYLAANKCETAAMALIEEMPLLKAYVPPKPAKVTNADYIKYLARSSVNSTGLKEVLTDYGNSKNLAEEILDSDISITASFPGDSLLSKLKTIHDILKAPPPPSQGSAVGTTTMALALPSSSSNSDRINLVDIKQVPPVIRIEKFTNTDEGYECPTCVSNRLNRKSFAESSCQTEEEELGVAQLSQDEIRRIFGRTLMNDNVLLENIVQTINQHIQDSEGRPSRPESVVQKIASKVETETLIDKFMEELFQDFPIEEGDFTGALGMPFGELSNPATFDDVERNMSLMFGETGISNGPSTSLSSSVPAVTTSQNGLTDILCGTPNQNQNQRLSDTSTASTSTTSTEADKIPGKPNEDSSSLPGSSSTRRPSSVKRITPTPIPSTVNPVFKTSVVVEKQTIDFGDKTSQISVIRKEIEPPTWSKLKRKSIQPKIPGQVPPAPVEIKVRVLKKDTTDKVMQLGPGAIMNPPPPPMSSGDDVKDIEINKVDRVAAATATATPVKNDLNKSVEVPPPPSSQKKRKATPVKLSPEKAKNSEYNFMHFCSEKSSTKKKAPEVDNKIDSNSVPTTSNSTSLSKIDSNSVPTTSSSSSTSVSKTAPGEVVAEVEEISQPVATPMQCPPQMDMNSAGLKTISPNALRMLITSASKIYSTTSSSQVCNFMNKKKSFSTPRKRKHVRNLSFATPPSLKATTPGHNNSQLQTVSTDPRDSLKRKAIEENYEFKSKKRLSWPESGKKKKTENLEETLSEPKGNSVPVPTPTPANAVCIPPSMPTILEENSSNLSMVAVAVDEVPAANTVIALSSPPQENPTSDLKEGEGEAGSTPTSPTEIVLSSSSGISSSTSLNSKSEPPLFAVPVSQSEGNVVFQYYQLAEDMKTLIPVSLIASPMPEESPRRSSSSFVPAPVVINPDGTVNAFMPIQSQELLASSQTPNMVVTPNEATPPVSHPQNIMSPLSSTINLVARGDIPEAMISPARRVAFDLSISSSSGSDTPPIVEYQSSRRKTPSKPLESKIETPPEPISPPRTSSGSRSRKSSRGRTKVSEEAIESEGKRDKVESWTNARLLSSELKTREELQPQPPSKHEDYSPEQQRPKRSRSRKEKEKDKSKKPKITFGSKFSKEEIFGKTPVKNSQPNTNVISPRSKLSADARAARTVAADAVPLGSPRRSPRKHLTRTPLRNQVPPPAPTPAVVIPPPVPASVDLEAANLPELPMPMPTPETVQPPPPTTEPEPQCIQPQPPQPQIKVTKPLPQPQENTSFHLVPAPIGFPDPTPVKNFPNGFSSLSELHGLNSPLVTPFKFGLQVNMNETQMTLPPTPRMIEDFDSGSNSTHSLRLTYDGVVPINLLTSTPMKPGIPRTPGRCSNSSSSNSHSPVLPEKGKALGQPSGLVTSFPHPNPKPPLQHPPPGPPHPPPSQQAVAVVVEKQNGVAEASKPQEIVQIVKEVPSKDQNLELSLKCEEKCEKSDGEISSSDEEDEEKEMPVPTRPSPIKRFAIPSKPITNPPKLLPINRSPALTIISSSTPDLTSARSRKLPVKKPEIISTAKSNNSNETSVIVQNQNQSQQKPKPHISISISPNIKQTTGVDFQVGDRGKKLTLSEQTTLVSLLDLQYGDTPKKQVQVLEPKKDVTCRPVGTASVISQQQPQQQQQQQPPPLKTAQPQPQKPSNPLHALTQKMSIHDLLRVARKKGLNPPAKNRDK